MIVRILGEGQYDVSADDVETLEKLDGRMAKAIESNDAEGFAAVLDEIVAKVRAAGEPVDPDTIVPSELTIPHEGASLDEVKSLLASEDAPES